MVSTGSFVCFQDDRLPALLRSSRWLPDLHKQLLLGELSWQAEAWPEKERPVLHELIRSSQTIKGLAIDLSNASRDGVAVISSSLPDTDNLTPLYVRQFGLEYLESCGISILQVQPYMDHQGIKILKGTFWGVFAERETGISRGLASDMFAVGRMDVRYVNSYTTTFDEEGRRSITLGQEGEGCVVEGGHRRVRATARQARRTASLVADAVHGWEEFKLRRESRIIASRERDQQPTVLEIEDSEHELIAAAFVDGWPCQRG